MPSSSNRSQRNGLTIPIEVIPTPKLIRGKLPFVFAIQIHLNHIAGHIIRIAYGEDCLGALPGDIKVIYQLIADRVADLCGTLRGGVPVPFQPAPADGGECFCLANVVPVGR